VKWVRQKADLEFNENDDCISGIGFTQDITDRKQMKEEQQESDFLFSQMFEQTTTSTGLYSPDGTIIKTNSEFCKMFGFEEKTIINSGYNLFKDKATIDGGVIPLLRDIFDKKKTKKWEIDFNIESASESTKTPTSKTGKIFLEVFGYPVLNSKGDLKYVVLQHYDITERKQAEQAIQKSNSLLSSIIESPDNIIMFALDTNYNYLSFNNAHVIEMKKVYGADIEIGQHIFSYMLREDDQFKSEINYKRVLKGERFIEIQKYGEAGSRFWYELIFNPISNTSNQVTGLTVFITNITKRKRIESELKKKTHDIGERNKELKCLFAISILFEKKNISLEKIFQRIVNLIPPAWQYPEITCAQIIFTDTQYKTSNFEPSNWKQHSNILIDGKHTGTVEVYYLKEMPPIDEGPFLKEERDLIDEIAERITRFIERKEAEGKSKKFESQLQQAQKMESIGILAGGIAHDFNNILFPIIGYTEMILMDTPEDSPVRDSLNQIYTSALRAKDLVKQILTFSRQGSGELMLMAMQQILKEALKLIRSTIPTTIEIKQDINPNCGVIKADPTQIHQIVMNLTTNALHAMEETGGELKVSLKEVELGEYDIITPDMTPGIYACLTVADTGVGIDKNLTQKIFDPFFTTKKVGKGTGMGLSVVHGIVKSMNGEIQVYSEPGKGTHFHVYLPLAEAVKKQQATNVEAPIQGGTEQILFVDDEEAILSMGKRMLERLGYQVTSRTSSIEALEAFRDSPDKFDLVITDMTMPNMSGDKLSVKLTKIRPDIPVLLCTGFSETMSEEKAASIGIKGFLLKPIVMKDLAQKIREVLDNKLTGMMGK
jgi:PAS domain S-box-containing protein